MKLTCNRKGKVLLLDVDQMLIPELQHWFAIRKTNLDGVWSVPDRKVWALMGYYEAGGKLEVTPELNLYLEQEFSLDRVRARIRPELKHYRGGYEADIVAHAISERRHLLFTDMGSGKSMMALEIARLTGPTILVCPPGAWYNAYVNRALADDGLPKGDLLRYYKNSSYNLSFGTWMGAARKKDRLGLFRVPRDIYAVSPYLIGGILDELLQLPWCTLIVDEAALARDSDGQLFNALKVLATRGRFRYPMTGYPYPRTLGNIWTQVHITDPLVFGTEREFVHEFASKGSSKKASKAEFHNEEANRQILARLCDRKLVTCLSQEEFWPERPKLEKHRVRVALSEREREEYDRASKSLEVRFGAETLRITSEKNTKTTKLRELAAGFVYRDRKSRNGGAKVVSIVPRPAKMVALKKLLRTHCRGERVVIWYHFEAEIELIQRVLDELNIEHAYYKGTGKEAIDALHRFSSGDARVLLTHPQSAGHGIRLTEACHMIFTSPDWISDYHEQAIKRVYRPPQRRTVHCWYLIAEDTKDQEILDQLRRQAANRDEWDQLLRSNRIPLSPIVPHQETLREQRKRRRAQRQRKQHRRRQNGETVATGRGREADEARRR